MKGTMRVLLAIGAVTALVFVMPARCPALDINHFDTPPGERHFVLLYSSDNLAKTTGQVDFFYSYVNVGLEKIDGGLWKDASKNQHLVSLGVGYAVTDNFQLGAVLPYLVDQGSEIAGVDSSGLGDLHLEGKWRLCGGKDRFGCALVPFVNVNAGETQAFMSAGSTSLGGMLVVDRNWCDHSYLTFNLGYVLQEDDEVILTPSSVSIGDAWLLGVGYSQLFWNGKTRMGAELKIRSDGGLFSGSRETPMEFLGWVSQKVAKSTDVLFGLGTGTGLTDGYGTPDWRVFAGVKCGF